MNSNHVAVTWTKMSRDKGPISSARLLRERRMLPRRVFLSGLSSHRTRWSHWTERLWASPRTPKMQSVCSGCCPDESTRSVRAYAFWISNPGARMSARIAQACGLRICPRMKSTVMSRRANRWTRPAHTEYRVLRAHSSNAWTDPMRMSWASLWMSSAKCFTLSVCKPDHTGGNYGRIF